MGGPPRGGGAGARQPALDRRRQPPEPRPRRARRAARASSRDWFRGAGWHVDRAALGRRLRARFAPAGRRAAARAARGPGQRGVPGAAAPAAGARAQGGDRRRPTARRTRRWIGCWPTCADEALARAVADVGGHDLAAILDAYDEAGAAAARPCVILADTIKGWGCPFAGDPMNHGALLTRRSSTSCATRSASIPGTSGRGFPPGSAGGRAHPGAPAPYAPPAAEPPRPRCPTRWRRPIRRRPRRRRRSGACSAGWGECPSATASSPSRPTWR